MSALDPRSRSGQVLAPAVVFSIDSEPLVAVGETAHQGAPLLTVLNRRNYRRFALQGTDWLIDLANTSRRDEPASASRIASDVLAEFELNFGGVIEPASLAEARRVLTRLEGLPLVCEHRDFSPWNLFVTPDEAAGGIRLGIVRARGTAVARPDLLPHLHGVGPAAGGIRPMSSAPGTPRHDRKVSGGEVHHECLVRYVGGVRLDAGKRPRALPPRLDDPLAVGVSPAGGDAGGRPAGGALRRSLFLQLWRRSWAGSAGARPPPARAVAAAPRLGLRARHPDRGTPGSRRTRSTGQS